MPHRHPTVGEWIVEQARQLSREQKAAGDGATPRQVAAGDDSEGFIYEPETPNYGEAVKKPSRGRQS